MREISVSGIEAWREYDFDGRVYRIDNPQTVVIKEGGSTHRVIDAEGIVHVVPAPGYFGCVLRFQGSIIA